ncbi:Gustatory receptor 74 [Frankliniella occidentalis]|nr:Gustatory receptor 74 [Frankliniella occidentalis]
MTCVSTLFSVMAAPSASWRSLVDGHWRLTLLVMQLTGFTCCGGWPPHWTRSSARRAIAAASAFAVTRALALHYVVHVVGEDASRSATVGRQYVITLLLAGFVAKNLGLLLTMAAMLHESCALGLLVRAALLHAHAFPAHKHEVRAGVVIVLAVFPAIFTTYSIASNLRRDSTLENIVYAVNDEVPVLLFSIVQDSFNHVVSSSIYVLEGIADDAQERVAEPACIAQKQHAQGGDEDRGVRLLGRITWDSRDLTAHLRNRPRSWDHRDLRALRVRYQCVVDAVLATNRLYGPFNTLSSVILAITCAVCLYTGLSMLYTYQVMGTLLWGIVITTKFAFICIMGEQMSVENRRILAALQTGLANHPDMDFQRKGEISRFIHQIQMQDIRVKAFDSSSYYDLTTLKRAVASVATFIIVLIQFAALVAQAASDGSVPKCNCQKC